MQKISKRIYSVGVNDSDKVLFEGLWPLPYGVSYNSYLVVDDKVALIDTVEAGFEDEFLENISLAIGDRAIDYLVVNHMEPDHCALIEDLVLRYPELKLIGNAKTLTMIKQFFDFEVDSRFITVKEGDVFETKNHKLTFVMAPMVHWPEAMFTYDITNKILFSADAFGTFGALNGNLYNDEVNFDRDWIDDARRYYTNIVGKYGQSVQTVLKKASTIEINMICPLHGPVWRSDLGYFIDKYNKWSLYEPEDKSVMIVYGSMYGNTESVAEKTATLLSEAGVKDVRCYDVSSTHVSYLISEAFRCSHIVLAAPTYNGGVFTPMENFLVDLKAHGLQKRSFAIIENGTWGPVAGCKMRSMVEEMKDMKVLESTLTVRSSMKENQIAMLEEMVKEVVEDLNK